jgi:sugar diacid utilization regulator
MHATVNAVAEGYDTEGARLEAVETRATEDFIELLAREDAGSSAVAERLGFKPDAGFRVVALIGPAGSLEVARAIASAVEQRGGVAKRAQRGASALVILQGIERAHLDEILARAPSGAAIGVGREVGTLADVRCSLEEAERALELSSTHERVCNFEDDWLLAAAMSGNGSVSRMLEPGMTVGKAHPHLAEAVRVFAESLSMAEGARRLRVSHNSFRYRLMRWQTLTGWTPWTLDGLARSILALQMAEAPDRS